MISIGVLVQQMFILYGMAFIGWIARKTNVLNEHTNQVLTQLILYFTLPALILFSLDIPFSFSLMKEFVWLVAMSVYILTISIFLANRMRKRSSLLDSQKSAYEGIILFGNQGFIGFAIIFILLGEEGVVYLTMFNLCYFILIWTYGIYLFSKNKGSIRWKNIWFNPGTVSTLIGIILFLLPIHFPTTISTGLEMVGKMTIPLSMMIIGSFISDIPWKNLMVSLKDSSLWKVAIAKLLIIPLLLLPFTFLSVPFTLLIVAVIVSGMPSAPTMSLYAQKYGGDAHYASLGVLMTTLLCIVTVPFLYFVLHYTNGLF
ncbi:AEC family transporter [Bacillus niameyensis]|uniref:AEC family transporter n=1 Tax=Bacillus niameyensis TaxID=1522308 RepID=UPI00078553D5|nr:AEC family transporter [Bacillus niameyensis]